MYIKITVVLLLYGSIAGEYNVNNTSRDENKTDNEYYSRFYDVLSLNTREENENGTIWKSYEHTKEVQPPPRRDGYPELSAKRELRSDSYDNNKSQAHLSFAPSSNNFKNRINESFESNFSDPMEADGTYYVHNYMHPPNVQNEYYRQAPASHINLQQMEYGRQQFRVNPCIPYAHSYQHPQQNRYRRSETAESDPYEAQGTYNIQGYMQPYQQGNQYPVQQYFQHHRQGVINYNNRLAVNPCMPQPPPSPRREYHIYPYPNPPKHGHFGDSRRNPILPQRITNYAPLPNENYIYPRPPNDNHHIKGINEFTPPVGIPITTRSRNKGHISWSTWTTPTPRWTTPSIRTPRSTTPSIRTPHCKTPSIRTTPPWNTPSTRTTPPWNTPSTRTMPPWYTPSTRTRPPWNTPSTRTRPPWNTPSTRTRPPWNTPSTRTRPPWNTPSTRTRPPWNTPSTRTPKTSRITPGSRTKSYYTPENGRRKNGTPPWKRHTTPTVRPRPRTPPTRRTKGYNW